MIPLRDHNPTRIVPVVTMLLITVNVAVFLYQLDLLTHGERALLEFLGRMSMVPARLTHEFGTDAVRSVFTSMFVRGGFLTSRYFRDLVNPAFALVETAEGHYHAARSSLASAREDEGKPDGIKNAKLQRLQGETKSRRGGLRR